MGRRGRPPVAGTGPQCGIEPKIGNFSVLVAIQKRAPQARPGAAQRRQAARSAASGPDRRCGPLGPYIEPVILALFPHLQFSLWAQK